MLNCQIATFVKLWSYLQIAQVLAKADTLVIIISAWLTILETESWKSTKSQPEAAAAAVAPEVRRGNLQFFLQNSVKLERRTLFPFPVCSFLLEFDEADFPELLELELLWIGICVLNFLSIFSCFLSQEKLKRKAEKFANFLILVW